jgi:hypothetical protein
MKSGLKRALLGGGAVLYFAALAMPRQVADAQVVVNDPVHIGIQAVEFVQQAQRHVETIVQENMHHVQRIAQGAEQLARLETQVRQAYRMYEAVTNVDSVMDAVGLVSRFGFKTPLPVSPYALMAILNGTGGVQGMLGSMRGLFAVGINSNNRYTNPDPMNWVGRQLSEQINGLTGAQAAAMSIHEQIEQRQDNIAVLQSRLSENLTPAERDTIRGNIEAEQTQIQRLQTSMQTVNTFIVGQREIWKVQQEQQSQKSLDDFVRDGCASAAMSGACGT